MSRRSTVRRVTCWTVSALHVNHGAHVRIFAGPTGCRIPTMAGVIASAHYAGPPDGSGTVTLCTIDGRVWTGPATTRVEVVR